MIPLIGSMSSMQWEKREAACVRAQNAKEKQAMAEAAGRNKRKGRCRTN
jgi:hypothetical protein